MLGLRFSLAPLFALVVFVACAGIIWLAHIEAGEMTVDRRPPLVKAAATPLKRAPDDPGGRAVADLGGVGDLLREEPNDAEERLLPRAEQPLTPADGSGGETRSEARAALEALVSEIRNDRSGEGDDGAGGPNTESTATFPSRSKPAETATADAPSTANGGVTERAVSSLEPATTALEGQTQETPVAATSSVFEATPDGRYRVQLAAVREEEDARRAWDLFQRQLGPFISGLQPFFERAETSNGIFYRVQVGPFGETDDADRLCVELKKQNASCFVVAR